MQQMKAKLTVYDNGKMVVEPYAQTHSSRYTPLLELEYGTLSTTRQHYRLLLMFPRRDGLMAIVRHLVNDTNRVAQFITRMIVHGGECA